MAPAVDIDGELEIIRALSPFRSEGLPGVSDAIATAVGLVVDARSCPFPKEYHSARAFMKRAHEEFDRQGHSAVALYVLAEDADDRLRGGDPSGIGDLGSVLASTADSDLHDFPGLLVSAHLIVARGRVLGNSVSPDRALISASAAAARLQGPEFAWVLSEILGVEATARLKFDEAPSKAIVPAVLAAALAGASLGASTSAKVKAGDVLFESVGQGRLSRAYARLARACEHYERRNNRAAVLDQSAASEILDEPRQRARSRQRLSEMIEQ